MSLYGAFKFCEVSYPAPLQKSGVMSRTPDSRRGDDALAPKESPKPPSEIICVAPEIRAAVWDSPSGSEKGPVVWRWSAVAAIGTSSISSPHVFFRSFGKDRDALFPVAGPTDPDAEFWWGSTDGSALQLKWRSSVNSLITKLADSMIH